MKSILVRLRERHNSLSATEEAIALYVRLHPLDAAELTVRGLAERTGTSASSVLRLCRSIGFSGYKEFSRALLIEATAAPRGGMPQPAVLAEEADAADVTNTVLDAHIRTLDDTRLLLEPEAVEKTMHLIRDARQLIFFGMGSSLVVAEDAQLKFVRIGKPCFAHADWHAQLVAARNADASDLGVFFSYSGKTKEMIACQEALIARGAPSVAISSYRPSPIADKSTVWLPIAAGEPVLRSGAMSSRIAQLAVVDIVYSAYLNACGERAFEALRRTHISKD